MNCGIFIQANTRQGLGALVAKHALETRGGCSQRGIPVTIINVEDVPAFRAFVGKPYRSGAYAAYTFDDLQSFTLTRFMPPELMGFSGRALVIDPDVFALTDIGELLSLDLGEAAIAACPKHDAWDTSVMLLDCGRLSHWKIADMLAAIERRERSYEDFIRLTHEPAPILALSRNWNSLDSVTSATKMLHTTNRLTQPWSTGLPIDFTRNRAPRILGVIPREPLLRLVGKYPSTYQPHPDKAVESAFVTLLREAMNDGAITPQMLEAEVRNKRIRPDINELLARR